MKAQYKSTLGDEPLVEIDASSLDHISCLVGEVRQEADGSAVEPEGGVPLIALYGPAATLLVAPVDDRFMLFFTPRDTSISFTSLDPTGNSSNDLTYWFYSGGSASELPQRFSISSEAAMLAIAEFLRNPDVMPFSDGFVWEPDWVVPSQPGA